ncbi:hypothetical protein [Cellulomonas hominis]|uniref:hypothetical protein n=1 Tax=Cellulomonas hominis TaxID=156981 RepID=UPI001649D41D|nr:hypothetical protein [Cellulomonas hominis]
MTATAEAPDVDGFVDPGPGGGGSRRHPDREAAWAHALAEMESVADQAEALLRAARAAEDAPEVALTEPWRVPRGLGALPAVLAPRAAALVERQRDLVQRTAEQLGEHRRTLRMTEAMRTRAAASPVYLDAEA